MISLPFSCLFLSLLFKYLSNINTYTHTLSIFTHSLIPPPPVTLVPLGAMRAKSQLISMKYPSTALVVNRLFMGQGSPSVTPGCDHFLSFQSVPCCPVWRPNTPMPPALLLFLIFYWLWNEKPFPFFWVWPLNWCTFFVF